MRHRGDGSGSYQRLGVRHRRHSRQPLRLYTAIVNGKNGATGVGLVEAYDLDLGGHFSAWQHQHARVCRDRQQRHDRRLHSREVAAQTTNVLVRAIGPSLTRFRSYRRVCADPTLELHDGNGDLIQGNDNWKDTQQTEIEATGLQPDE